MNGSYNWKMMTLTAGIDNVLNQPYYMPLGGILTSDIKTGRMPMPGMGRSFNVSLAATF